MEMDANKGNDVISTAFKEHYKDQLYQMYLAQLPVMLISDSFISFEDYYENSTARPTSNDPEEVYSNVENIIDNFEI